MYTRIKIQRTERTDTSHDKIYTVPFIFQDTKIKRAWFNDEWWFCVSDVVEALTYSADVKQYVKKCAHMMPK